MSSFDQNECFEDQKHLPSFPQSVQSEGNLQGTHMEHRSIYRLCKGCRTQIPSVNLVVGRW